MSNIGNDNSASSDTEEEEAYTPWLLRTVKQYDDDPKRSRKPASWLMLGQMPILFVEYLFKTRNFIATFAALDAIWKIGAPDHRGIRWLYRVFAYQAIIFIALVIVDFFNGLNIFEFNVLSVFIHIFDWLGGIWSSVAVLFAKATITFQELVAFVISGIGVSLLFWRTKSLDKQVRVNEGGLEADRFRDGCKMLTEEHYSARHAGIVTLSELARSNPALYTVRVIDVLTDFLRRPDAVPDINIVSDPVTRPDKHHAFIELASLWKNRKTRRRYCKVRTELNLENIDLSKNTFAGFCLQNVSFYRARFVECNFLDVDFRGASMQRTEFENCEFSAPNFQRTTMTGTVFHNCAIGDAKWDGAYLSAPKFTAIDPSTIITTYDFGRRAHNESTTPVYTVCETELIKAWVVCSPTTKKIVIENGINGSVVLIPEPWRDLSKFRLQTVKEAKEAKEAKEVEEAQEAQEAEKAREATAKLFEN